MATVQGKSIALFLCICSQLCSGSLHWASCANPLQSCHLLHSWALVPDFLHLPFPPSSCFPDQLFSPLHKAQMAEHWIQRDMQFLCLELCNISSCPCAGRNRWGTVTSRKYEGEKDAYGLRKYYVLTPEYPHGLCVAFPLSLDSGSWWLLGSFTNTVKGFSLIQKNPTMSQLEVTIPEVLDFHSE